MIDPRTPERVFEECEARRKAQFDHSIRIMAQMDDLAEAMALAIEAHGEQWAIEACLNEPLAAWRAFRPTKGLVKREEENA